MKKLTRIKRVRLHHEGTPTLLYGFVALFALNVAAYFLFCGLALWPFYVLLGISLVVYAIIVTFFRCPIRIFQGETTENVVVAPADGRVVVAEEGDEEEYFHERRFMISIFMSPLNVHANWFPCDGFVRKVEHHNGNFHKAWLPKASVENERSAVIIDTPSGHSVLVRQIAGAMARRIVTYARENEECYIDEHLGFIKFGSRVDVYLPLGSEVCVEVGQKTIGNRTVIAKMKQVDPLVTSGE